MLPAQSGDACALRHNLTAFLIRFFFLSANCGSQNAVERMRETAELALKNSCLSTVTNLTCKRAPCQRLVFDSYVTKCLLSEMYMGRDEVEDVSNSSI